MKKKIYTALMISVLSSYVFGQVGINTETPQGILHIKNKSSIKQGVVMPIVDSATITRTPSGTAAVEATVVFDSINQCLRVNAQNG